MPGRAQQATNARFAFADTTLLRDTLGLSFSALFPLADSLRMTPDTLRALAIRFRFSPERLVQLADSMRVPVDSVGPVLLRERFNPLGRRVGRVTEFTYNTTYNIQETRTAWINLADFNYVGGLWFLRNSTSIQSDRLQAGGRTSFRRTRSSITEGGWKVGRNTSAGGRALYDSFDSDDPSAITSVGETKNEYQLSLRTRQRGGPNLLTELNLFSGVLNLTNSAQEKRGLTGDFNGRLQFNAGTWLVHELNGQITGNLSRTRMPEAIDYQRTYDLTRNLRGTLGLWDTRPIGMRGNLAFRNVRVETPQDTGGTRIVRTANTDLDATAHFRLDNDRYVNVTPKYGTSQQTTAQSGQSTRDYLGVSAEGRYNLRGWSLEGRFGDDRTVSEVPLITSTGGYGERVTTHTLDGTLSRQLSPKLTGRMTASIGLTSYRYYIIGSYPTPPVSRDQARQGYRVEGIYNFSAVASTGLALDVSRNQLVNIPSASTAANNVTRLYAAEWRWTYRLLQGLTVTQRNTMRSNYLAYNFLTGSDRLSLDFSTVTTLNAVLTPRLTIDITHNGQYAPSGNYNQNVDGLYYFSPADRSRAYTLSTRISYTPSPLLSISAEPRYRWESRTSTLNGVSTPTRQARSLSFAGTANVNLPLGRRGRLTGNIGQSYTGDRTTTFSSGIAEPSPRSETRFVYGSLQFSWSL